MTVHVEYKGVLSEGRLREILREADVNKDNDLSKAELKKALKELGSKLPPYRAWRCLLEADGNRDGKISPSEMDDLVRYLMDWYHRRHGTH